MTKVLHVGHSDVIVICESLMTHFDHGIREWANISKVGRESFVTYGGFLNEPPPTHARASGGNNEEGRGGSYL